MAAQLSERLAGLLLTYSLGPAVGEGIAALVAAVAEDPHAPCGIKDPAALLERQVADALVALRLPALRRADPIVDLGSGAGFPGLPLALALPTTRFILLEASGRCARFLRGLTHTLGLANVEVVWARAELWAVGRAQAGAVVAKAVGPPPVVVEYATPLLRLGGLLVEWRVEGPDLARGAAAAAQLGLRPLPPFRYGGEGDRRLLALYEKLSPTPAGFPRRPGVAQRRPLA